MERKNIDFQAWVPAISRLFQLAEVGSTFDSMSSFRINLKYRSVAFRKEGSNVKVDVWEKNKTMFSILASYKRRWSLKPQLTPVNVIVCKTTRDAMQGFVQTHLDALNVELDATIKSLSEMKQAIVTTKGAVQEEVAEHNSLSGILEHIHYALQWYEKLLSKLVWSHTALFCQMFDSVAPDHIDDLALLVERYAGLDWRGVNVWASVFNSVEAINQSRQVLERLTQTLSLSQKVHPLASGLSHSFAALRMAMTSLQRNLWKNAEVIDCT